MTQIRKAFYAAIQNAVRANFQTIFSKALKEKAEQSLSTAVQKIALPVLTAQNLPHLTPEKKMAEVICCVDSLINDAFQSSLHQAMQNILDAGYGRYAEKALENLDITTFHNLQEEIISQWLNDQGLPISGYAIGFRFYKLLYAKKLFEKLCTACTENADEDFTACVERLNIEAAREAYLFMADCPALNQAATCTQRIVKHFLCELALWRRKSGDADLLHEEKKIALNAFTCKR